MAELVSPKRVRKLRSLRYFQTLSGHTVVVLPTCSVPIEHLMEENWAEGQASQNMGNVRIVNKIRKLIDGTELKLGEQLWVKHPETIFPKEKGILWSGWQDMGKNEIAVTGNRLVEQQAKWEARYLIGLLNSGLKAEEPQAVVLYKGGRKAVITKGIARLTRTLTEARFTGMPYDKMIEIAKSLGALPVDDNHHNAIMDEEGSNRIIDVNRWAWKQPEELREKAKRENLPFYDSTKYLRKLIAELDRLRPQT